MECQEAVYHLEDLGVVGSIILKLIFKEWNGRYGLNLSGSKKSTGGGRMSMR